MNFRRQSREEVSVNLTPLIDIVFLLLIFFMVSTTFTKENHLNLSLPEATTENNEAVPNAIEITISEDAVYSINGTTLVKNELQSLIGALQEALGNEDSLPVVITADAKATHESVVKAMDAVGQLGLVNLSITTRKPAAAN
ncbi:MAG: biopolymer transporter ExbD [Oleibacter sp.]|nr:biopolymer transporter ExbD [Thalassolituus sp.]